MKKILFWLLVLLIVYGCGESELEISTNAKVKTKYIYSSSTVIEPYSFTTYTYDKNWNLIKELISDYPNPPTSSYTYHYDVHGRLEHKKYNSKTGLNHSNQTESSFSVIREYKYQYTEDLQIEMIYRDGELRDSVVCEHFGELLLEENHFSKSLGAWSIINEYNKEGNLIKVSEYPDNIYTTYEYDESKIVKSEIYNSSKEIVVENTYVYTKSGKKEIVEVLYDGIYGEFISEKTTYINGNVIEYIKYHPTFQGSEWYCYRYEYY